jgi:hypothetical protein
VGGHPYSYFTPYEADIGAALEKLRAREYQAGRYDSALEAADPPTYAWKQFFPPDPSFPAPGAQHASIEAAIEAASMSGTCSILDIQGGISLGPASLCASPIPAADLISIFGSSQPDRDMLDAAFRTRERSHAFWNSIPRGQARYLIVYAGGVPAEIFFAGMSCD